MSLSKPKALIYCRVSSERQKTEGHGLESQEHRCREYADRNGFEVEMVFRDSYSGGGDFMKRPAMSEMLEYTDKRPFQKYIVIFDDLKRFARDVQFHLKLRAALKSRDITPHCLNFSFDGTPEGEYVEVILAAGAELERKQNKRQVVQKMKARLEAGYWPFFPIPGYTQEKVPGHGRVLSLNDRAKVVKEALEGFASGRLPEKVDVQRFLQENHYKGNQKVYIDAVNRLLARAALYAGFIEYKPWDVSRRKGHHQGLIDMATFSVVEAKFAGKARRMNRVDINPLFPARGYVLCAECSRPMTGSKTTKPRKGYVCPRYRCNTKTCPRYNKSIRADVVHQDLAALLKRIQPKSGVMRLGKAILTDVWNRKEKNFESESAEAKKKIEELQTKIDNLLVHIANTENEKIVAVYEKKIEGLTLEQENIRIKQTPNEQTSRSFETALNEVAAFLESPYTYWINGGVHEKRLVLKLVFSDKLPYHFESGIETANLCCVLKVFEEISHSKTQDVEVAGLDPRAGE